MKRLFRHLQRVRAAKETLEHAHTVDLCRQAAETLEPGKRQAHTADLQEHAIRSAPKAARRAKRASERRKCGLTQAQKRPQGKT